MPFKEVLSFLAVALTVAAYLPYIVSILRGQTKPHVFSWITWGFTTLVASFAALSDNGGFGAWPITFSGLVACYVAWLAYRRRGITEITRTDWAFFLAAAAAVPLWAVTHHAVVATLVLTAVDMLGYGPIMRRAYGRPYDELLWFYVMMVVRNSVAIAALQHYSLTTVTFPAAIGATCGVFVIVVLWRRQALPARG